MRQVLPRTAPASPSSVHQATHTVTTDLDVLASELLPDLTTKDQQRIAELEKEVVRPSSNCRPDLASEKLPTTMQFVRKTATFTFLVQDRHVASGMPVDVATTLTAWGHDVRIVVPEERPFEVLVDKRLDDVYVLRTRSHTGLAMAAELEARGAVAVNMLRGIQLSSSKATTAAVLRAAGIPHPATFLAERIELLHALPQSAYPLVIKPMVGEAAEGVRLVSSARELRGAAGALCAQAYVPNDGVDEKAYVVGDEVRLVRKPSPLQDLRWVPFEQPVTADIRELALACGRAFGLEVYGVDILRGPSGLQVVEVNDFPSFRGLENPEAWIARHLVWRAIGAGSAALAEIV